MCVFSPDFGVGGDGERGKKTKGDLGAQNPSPLSPVFRLEILNFLYSLLHNGLLIWAEPSSFNKILEHDNYFLLFSVIFNDQVIFINIYISPIVFLFCSGKIVFLF